MDLLKLLKKKAYLARQFSLSDWLSLVEAWWMLFYFHLALRWVSYELIIAPILLPPEITRDVSIALSVAQMLQRLVGYASRLHLIPMTCLIKSITLQKMLNRRNIPAQVCIGVNKTLAEIHAHAWVEVNGVAIGEAEDVAENFKVLKSVGRIHS
jgi:hypothetical protein